MASKDMVPLGAAIASDVLSTFSLPGGATLEHVAQQYVEKKKAEAANILIEELSNGYHGTIRWEGHDVDPLIEIIFRFSKAVADGAARENLRLLAMIIAGLKKHRTLDGDKFRRWAGILEQLTRDELMVVGTGYVILKRIEAAGTNAANDFWQQLQFAFQQKGYSQPDLDALCASVSRTGLLTPVSAFSGMAYMASEWLNELGTLAELEKFGLK